MNKQRGNVVRTIVNTLIVLVVGFILLKWVFGESLWEESLKDVSNTAPATSVEGKALIDDFEKKDSGVVTPSGVYQGKSEYRDREVTLTYYFTGNQVIEKDLKRKGEIMLSGSASYKMVGSTIKYADIKGARYLFPQEGEAISLNETGLLTIHSVDSNIELKSLSLLERETAEQKIEEVKYSTMTERSWILLWLVISVAVSFGIIQRGIRNA